MGPIDLHTHSTASDGRLTPQKLVEKAVSEGLSVLGLTDHDSVAGIDEAWNACQGSRLIFVPGVELSTDRPGADCHILGYFVDHRHPRLTEALSTFLQERRERGERMVQRLRELGIPISWERVQELAQGGIVARPHVAEALLEAGYVSSRQEAFERYIGHGRPAYVTRLKFSPEEAVRLIRSAHGVPVLAHPTFADPDHDFTAELSRQIPYPFLESLCEAGLLGLEAYYTDYSPELSARLQELAQHFGLIVTGGSDFHGNPEGPALGSVGVPAEVVPRLLEQAQRCGSPWVSRIVCPACP
ncbi:MAG: PHP domain-containing protein [Chloroflexia bacterium]